MKTLELTKTKWTIDQTHSEIAFRVKHLMFSNVRGKFRDFNAHIYMTGGDFSTAEVDVRINPASIDTGTEARDKHLRSGDFLDTDNFNEISFVSDSLTSTDKGRNIEMIGKLRMKGVTRPVNLDIEFGAFVKDSWGVEKVLFSVTGKINRKEWGLDYHALLETGGLVVGEEVHILCEVQLIKQA